MWVINAAFVRFGEGYLLVVVGLSLAPLSEDFIHIFRTSISLTLIGAVSSTCASSGNHGYHMVAFGGGLALMVVWTGVAVVVPFLVRTYSVVVLDIFLEIPLSDQLLDLVLQSVAVAGHVIMIVVEETPLVSETFVCGGERLLRSG